MLADLAAKALAEHPQVVLVEGEAGMGKSSLVAKWVPTVGGAVVLRASGEEGEFNLGYGVISQVASAARSLGVRTPATLGDRLAEGVDALAVGAELLSIFDALGRSSRRLVVLVVDDLQWSDPPSAQALLFCLRRLLADRVLVLVTSRPGELARHGEGWYRFVMGDDRATRLQLGPLEVSELMVLSREMGRGELSRRAAASLLEHTGGNPLYCVALLQELGAEHLDRHPGPPRVPRDLASLLLAKVSRLEPAPQALVTAAAVLGQRSPLSLTIELAAVDDPLVALEQAVDASVLAEVPGELGGSVSFVHPLLRSAVYHDLGVARRRALHLRAAGLLGTQRGLPHRVAAATGADEALAADLENAAHRAQSRGRSVLAASLFTQAAGASGDTAGRERRLLDALEAHLAAGDVVGAQALAPAIEPASPSARRSALLGNLDLFAGRLASAERRLGEAWEGPGPPPASLAGALCEQVTVLLVQGRADEAAVWGRRAVESSAGNPSVLNRARGLLSLALVWGYRVQEAMALTEQLPGQAGQVAAEDLDALILRGIARLWAGFPDLASLDLSHAAARLRSGWPARYAGACLTYLACAEYLLGRWDDALVLDASASPLAVPIAIYDRLPVSLPSSALSGRVTPLRSGVDLVSLVAGEPGVSRGSPLEGSADPRLEVRQYLSDRLVALDSYETDDGSDDPPPNDPDSRLAALRDGIVLRRGPSCEAERLGSLPGLPETPGAWRGFACIKEFTLRIIVIDTPGGLNDEREYRCAQVLLTRLDGSALVVCNWYSGSADLFDAPTLFHAIELPNGVRATEPLISGLSLVDTVAKFLEQKRVMISAIGTSGQHAARVDVQEILAEQVARAVEATVGRASRLGAEKQAGYMAIEGLGKDLTEVLKTALEADFDPQSIVELLEGEDR